MAKGGGANQTPSKSYYSSPEESNKSELVLTILNDKYCRQLLDAITTQPLTAKELASRCDISYPTVYRKLDLLIKAEFVEKSTQIESDGNHTSVYQLSIDCFTISVNTKREFTISICK